MKGAKASGSAQTGQIPQPAECLFPLVSRPALLPVHPLLPQGAGGTWVIKVEDLYIAEGAKPPLDQAMLVSAVFEGKSV